MIKRFFLKNFIILLLFYSLSLNALKITIKGKVLEKKSGRNIAYANVALFSLKNSLISGTISDDNGKFELKNISKGDYKLKISFVGFKPFEKAITVNSNRNVGNIYIRQEDSLLDVITVKGDRGTYKNLVDKDVFVPDTALIKSSQSALELMAGIPKLKINRLDNSVKILGADNTMILINGQARNGNIHLNQINSQDIDRIEIIDNPDAEYGGEYASVINIILKKKKNYGLSITISPNYYGKMHNESYLTAEYGYKKIRVFANYNFYFRNHPREVSDSLKSITNEDAFFNFTNTNYIQTRELGHFVQIGSDYFLNKKNTFNLIADYKIIRTDYLKKIVNRAYRNNSLLYNFNTNEQVNGNYSMQNYSLYYEHLFLKGTLTSDINLYFMNFTVNSDYIDTYLSENKQANRQQKVNKLKTSINYKLDYSTEINKHIALKTGYKLYQRNINEKFWDIDSQNFQFYELRQAAYFVLSLKNGVNSKFSSSYGIRLEQAQKRIFDTVNIQNVFLLPNFTFFYKFNSKSSTRFSIKDTYHVLNIIIYTLLFL